MKRFDKIKQVLDTLVGGQSIGGHGAFWRGISLDEFKSKLVFGYPLIAIGDSANSNIIKALRAQAPFGSDVGTSDAFFRRMPAGRQPASDIQIQYIADWIDAGCPDDEDQTIQLFALPGHQDPTHHNSYWREFDNWAMFNSPPDVQGAIGVFFPLAQKWFAFAKNNANEAAWKSAISPAPVKSALTLLSQKQKDTVTAFYGNPIDMDDLFDSYKKFGAGTLPPDPLRPQDPDHKMNGREMWFFWAAFADACLRHGLDSAFWSIEVRAILVGLIHDGLFRGRFTVQGFSADAAGSDQVLDYSKTLSDTSLQRELCIRLAQSGI